MTQPRFFTFYRPIPYTVFIMEQVWRGRCLPGETLVDLERDGLYLIQSPAVFPCGRDSVLLSDFASLRRDDRALDMGCGTGLLAILCYAKHGAGFTLLDSSLQAVDVARRNIAGNGYPFPVHTLDWCNAPAALGHGAFTAILCNPPYHAGGTKNRSPAQCAARQEGEGGLPSACAAAFLLLNNGGRFFCCYPAQRLADAIFALRNNRLEPKRLALVCGSSPGKPYLALIEAKKGGKPGLKIEME